MRDSLRLAIVGAALLSGGCCDSTVGGRGPPSGDDASATDGSTTDVAPRPDTGVSPFAEAGLTDVTAAVDGDSDGGGADAPSDAPAPTCGPPPARYTLLTGADSGLARDNVTGLAWMRDSVGGGEPPQTQAAAATYCAGRGMRLPTKDEALALAAGYASCAFGNWGTWTSSPAAGAGYAWVVDYTGGASPQVANNFPSAVLCARDAGG